MKVYLAGPITGLSYEEVVESLHLAKEVLEGAGYEVLSPMTGKGHLRNEIEFKAEGYGNPLSTNHAIFERDRWMVQICDVILADFTNGRTRVSIGTVTEIAWGALLGKHVVAVLPTEDNIHRHAFVLEAADVIFPSREEALQYLEKFIRGDL